MVANLYKRGKTWWGRITVAGVEYRESLRTRDRQEARARLEGWREEVGRAKFYGANRLTWKAAVLHYVEDVMPGSVGANTAKRYLVSFRQVEPHLEQYHLDQIGPRQIGQFIAERRKEDASNATINRDLTAISRVMAAGLGKGASEHNPARDYDRSMNREKREPIELPSREDINAAMDKAPTDLWTGIMCFAQFTGMRQMEVLSLEWSQIDLERGAITLHRTKGGRPRVVPLAGPLLAGVPQILATLRRERGQPLVFGRKGETVLKNFPSRYSAWRAKHGIRFRFHDLRHWFAVTYLQREGNIYDLQRILGHRSIKTTELYLEYLTPGERRKAMTGTAQNTAQP